MRTINDTVKNVTYYNEDNGYIILQTKSGNTLKGYYPESNLKDVAIKATGKWTKHKKYGLQFDFEKLEVDENPIFYFLTKVVKGIGPKLAKVIMETFGSSGVEEVLEQNPGQLVLVKGIKTKKAEKIIDSWKHYRNIKQVSSFLGKYGVSTNLVIKIFEHFNEKRKDKEKFDLLKEIKKDIYVITEVKGIGFKTADKIALASGIAPNDTSRIKACINYSILKYTQEEGNSCISREELDKIVKKETTIEQEEEKSKIVIKKSDIDIAIMEMVNKEKLTIIDEGIYTLPYLEKAETYLLNYLSSKSKQCDGRYVENVEDFIKEQEKHMGFKFSKLQKKAIEEVNSGTNAFILSGYAGTGKSTISKAILNLINHKYSYDEIMCCALSGIASDRIRKTTNYDAATIQSLIVKRQNLGEPLPYKVLLIDEASMVNSEIFSKIIRAVSPDTKIIMVGDPAQLPPIGAGNPFSDLIDSEKIKNVELLDIYRQSQDSVITLFANEIRKNSVPENFLNNYEDWIFYDQSIKDFWKLKSKVKKGEISEEDFKEKRDENNNAILKHIVNIAKSKKPLIREYFKERNLSGYIACLQVISPIKSGILGVENLNNILQEVVNNGREEKHIIPMLNGKYQLYDKIIHTNNKMMDAINIKDYQEKKDAWGKQKIFNGMIGVLLKINKEEETAMIYYPSDHILVEYSFDELKDNTSLAYALTCHKTQGSQFDNVVIPMTYSHYMMNDAKLLYTAVTRASDKIYIVGENSAFKTACKRVDAISRDTVLKRMNEKATNNAKEKEEQEEVETFACMRHSTSSVKM